MEAKKSLLQRISIRTFEGEDASFLQPRMLESIFHASLRKLCMEIKETYQHQIIALGTMLLFLVGIHWIVSIGIGLILPHVLSSLIYYYYDIAVLPKATPDLRSPSRFRARWLGSDKDVLYVATLDGNLVATFGIIHRDSTTCEAVRVMTIDGHQRKGIGNHLLKHVLKQCAEIGYKKIFLYSLSPQTEAHRMYRANHFEQTKIVDFGLYKVFRFERTL